MATNVILRVSLMILATPFLSFSRLAEVVNLWNLKTDLAICLQTIDKKLPQPIPGKFIQALVAAEDRRNAFHPGVDPIGIARAILARVGERRQGASTIEQQFVRVVTGHYET